MTKEDVRISIALVTRNRPESLDRCLKSLRCQNVQPFEVIVSDDSDHPSSPETLQIAGRYGCRYITGPRRGLYANRNHVAVACRGTHIRTMDDDHTFPDGHFARCLQSIHADPYSVWTTGEDGYVDEAYFGSTDTAFQLGVAGVGYPVTNQDDNWAIADGSTTFPADIFRRGLRMEESFGFGSSYLEFGIYLYAHGIKSRCIPDARVIHHAGTETVSRRFSAASGASRLFASVCFNCFFEPNNSNLVRFVILPTFVSFLRGSGLNFYQVLNLARKRWSAVHAPVISQHENFA